MQKDILANAQAQDNRPGSLYSIHYFYEYGNNLEFNEQCCKAIFIAKHVQRQGTLILFKIIKAAIEQLCSYANLYDPKTQSEIYISSNHPRLWEELEWGMKNLSHCNYHIFFFEDFNQSDEN